MLVFASSMLFICAVEMLLQMSGAKSGADGSSMNLAKIGMFKMGSPLKAVDPALSEHYERDRMLFWKMKPNALIDVNTRGHRGPARNFVKPQNTCRIIVLGDSCAFGWNVRNQDTYSYLLEKKLNGLMTKKMEVINSGIPGYSSLQGLRYFTSEGCHYAPDIALVAFGFNDLVEAVGCKDSKIPISPPWAVALEKYLIKSRSYVFLKRLILSNKYGRQQRYLSVCGLNGLNVNKLRALDIDKIKDLDLLIFTQSIKLKNAPLRRVPPQDFADNIVNLIECGRKNNVRMILLTLPSINKCFGYQTMLKLLASNYGVELIDLIYEFEKRNALTQDFFVDNNHYNENGHQLVAEIICQYLGGKGRQ